MVRCDLEGLMVRADEKKKKFAGLKGGVEEGVRRGWKLKGRLEEVKEV
jgi:hypothetical protein